jgi:uncharacterized protein
VHPFTAEELKTMLNLAPLELEGGYFRQTYRAAGTIPEGVLPSAYKGSRNYSTAIYFLLTPDTFSAMHRLPTDEVFHFYLGDPVEVIQITPGGTGETVVMGPDLRNAQVLQCVVPGGYWQGARLIEGGSWALLGTTVAPGFEFADYEHGIRAKLVREFPEYEVPITALTRL